MYVGLDRGVAAAYDDSRRVNKLNESRTLTYVGCTIHVCAVNAR